MRVGASSVESVETNRVIQHIGEIQVTGHRVRNQRPDKVPRQTLCSRRETRLSRVRSWDLPGCDRPARRRHPDWRHRSARPRVSTNFVTSGLSPNSRSMYLYT